jgi:hypothetical protein
MRTSSKLPGEIQRQASINVTPENWSSFKEMADDLGTTVAALLGNLIGVAMGKATQNLSVSGQRKVDLAIRTRTRQLAAEYEQSVQRETRKRVDEIILPEWKRLIAEAKHLYERRQGLMDKDTFNTIRRALHPDSRHSISAERLEAAFRSFMELEKFLLTEKDSPTSLGPVPNNLAAWDRLRAQVRAERAAKRGAMSRA